MPIERNILGEGWSREPGPALANMMEESTEEGLLAALSKVAIDRFPRIAIVDDNPDVRRLIRRILQSQGELHAFRSHQWPRSGGTGPTRTSQPDHPGLDDARNGWICRDGCAAIQPDTADIPVIVVTAKELTSG